MHGFMTDTTSGTDGVAEALGQLTALVGLQALGTWLLVSGLGRRKATGGAKGTGRVVAGSLVLAFVVLGTLGRLGQQA